MDIRAISGIARPVDPKFPTNRAIAAVTAALVAGDFLWLLLSGSEWLSSGLFAAGLGLSVFLAWAICREVDPDRDLAAFVAAGVAVAGTLLWGLPELAVLFWLLLVVRIVNRTTGLTATMFDSLVILLLAAWLAYRVWWPIGAFTVVGFWLDRWLHPPNTRHRVFGFLMLAVTLGAFLMTAASWNTQGPSWASVGIALLLCATFLPVLAAARDLTTLADDTQERLATARVRAGQVLVLVTGVSAVFWAGAAGLVMLWPVWSAVLGASAFLLIRAART